MVNKGHLVAWTEAGEEGMLSELEGSAKCKGRG